jgi:hypothetical protein
MSRPITPTTRPAMVRPRPAELSRSCPPRFPAPRAMATTPSKNNGGNRTPRSKPRMAMTSVAAASLVPCWGGGLLAVARSCGHLGLF